MDLMICQGLEYEGAITYFDAVLLPMEEDGSSAGLHNLLADWWPLNVIADV